MDAIILCRIRPIGIIQVDNNMQHNNDEEELVCDNNDSAEEFKMVCKKCGEPMIKTWLDWEETCDCNG